MTRPRTVALACLAGAPLLVLAAPARSAPEDAAWRAPVDGRLVVGRGFDPPERRWEAGHRGVDLVSHPGAAVRAAGSGVVTFAGVLAGRSVVAVTHGPVRTTYEPVTPTVRAGDAVDAGEVIGRLDVGHGRPGPGEALLHWGLRRADVYLDPLTLLGLGPIRLLPHWSAGEPPAVHQVPRAAHTAPAEPRRPSSGRAPPRDAGRPAAGAAAVGVLAASAVAASRARRR